MRDIVLILFIISILPFTLFRPQFGIYLWAWLSFMNPHRLTYGMAYDFPWAMVVAITSFFGILISKCKKNKLRNPAVYLIVVFFLWVTFTTIFALNPDGAFVEWKRVFKIQIFLILTLLLITDKSMLDKLIWVIVISFGYYSTRGGLATLLKGATNLQGPPGSFFADNNILALSILIVIPLMVYLLKTNKNKWIKVGGWVVVGLALISLIGSNSRGAFVTLIVVGLFFLAGSKNKFKIVSLILTAVFLVIQFAPGDWKARMSGIEDYEQDGSAMGRLNSWYFAINLALDKPLGGGLQVFRPGIYALYAPEPENFHDAHSIYFEVLAEQGWLGLIIFLSLWWYSLLLNMRTKKIIKEFDGEDEVLKERLFLSSMLQYSIIAYLSGGAFLGIAYFDLPYYLLVISYLNNNLASKEIEGLGRVVRQ